MCNGDRVNALQELSSCRDGRPYGHNRHGPKIGELLCPFPWGSWVPSNTMSSGHRPISVPSGILIHPAVWPQHTNVADRTGQTTVRYSTGRTVLQTVAQKRHKITFSRDTIKPRCYVGPYGEDMQNKNLSGDEIANVNYFTTISYI